MALAQTLEKITHDHILFRCKNVAAKGTLLVYSSTAGYVEKISGQPLDTHKCAGLLLQGVVNRSVPLNLVAIGDDTGTVDLPRNFNKNETYVSGVCRLLVHGFVESSEYDSTEFGQGSGVYLGADGKLSTAVSGANLVLREKVGHALSGKRDGFVRVFINIV